MKNAKLTLVFIALLGVIILSSCAQEQPTTGSLSVVAMDSTGKVIQGIQINLAHTLSDLQSKTYIKSDYTNSNGAVMFHDLLPDTYWVSATGWDDYSSARIYAGIDHYVVLWLNNPGAKK